MEITNLILAISSFVLALISVITVIITLRQNKVILENATRPYVTIYFDYTQTGISLAYFVIKNFGASSATITSLTYCHSIHEHPTSLSDMSGILDGLIENSIAPGQKFLIPFNLWQYPGETAEFDISYRSAKKKYQEHIVLNIKKYGNLSKPRLSNDEYKPLSYPLSEIAERLM